MLLRKDMAFYFLFVNEAPFAILQKRCQTLLSVGPHANVEAVLYGIKG